MTTNKPKMKGIFKGFKYISQIFDEEKEDEIQIGLPTDVKHVAHIGWDGPAVESPSWMKEFSSSPGLHSAPLGPPTGGAKGEPRKRDPTRKQRRNHSKDSEGSGKASRHQQDPSDPANPVIPDPAKKSRRKKSRESNGTGGSTRPRSRANSNADPRPDCESSVNHELDSISNT